MPVYRMLALDIDGTLLDSQGRLTPRVREAVGSVRNHGLEVCLVSNRRPRSMAGLARTLELTSPLVAFNGGVVADPETLVPMQAITLPLGVIRETLRAWHREGLAVLAYPNVRAAEEPDILYTVPPDWPQSAAYVAAAGPDAARVPSLAEMDRELLRVMVADSEQRTRRARQLAEPGLGADRVRVFHFRDYDGTWYYVIYPAGSTKSNGLRYLCRHFGFGPAEVVAVGDHINDLDMLEFAGLGVAMGNARTEVKRRADLVIGDCDQDGLADFIVELLAGRVAAS